VLLVLAPLLLGTVLLGKQLDVKHKTYDALRYSVWERTVWSNRGSNAKADEDVTVEALDRTFGHPRAGISSVASLREGGISQNPFWRDHQRQPMLEGAAVSATYANNASPIAAGYALVPGLAYGEGLLAVAAQALQMNDLELDRHGFVSATITTSVKPLFLQQDAVERAPLTQRASGAVLSDTWSSRDEGELRRRVDHVTANELLQTLEMPARPIAMQSIGKGGPLYGEGQYGWEPDLRPRSNSLPASYVTDRDRE
jgi:hypothetical protein